MFSRHAPADRSLRTYRVSDTRPLRSASIRRSRSSSHHANRHGCELSAEGAAMPARRMAAFVCRFTACARSIQLRDLAQYTQNQSDIPPMTITLAIGFQPACPATIPGWERPHPNLSFHKQRAAEWMAFFTVSSRPDGGFAGRAEAQGARAAAREARRLAYPVPLRAWLLAPCLPSHEEHLIASTSMKHRLQVPPRHGAASTADADHATHQSHRLWRYGRPNPRPCEPRRAAMYVLTWA